MTQWDEVIREVKRKSIHVIPGFLAIPIIIWIGQYIALIIAIFFFIIYSLNEIMLRKNINIKIPIAYQTYRFMARRDELEKRYFTGTVYFWGFTILIIALLPPIEAAAAIMISSLGDAAAAIIGKMCGQPRLPYNRNKSLCGTLAMFLVSYLSCIIAGVPSLQSILASSSSAVVESLTTRSVLDEITVPLTALIVFLLV
ncbi:hypothetical protein J4526_02270 [Desulfurococcaceae archaeon MEX13E-LK6-19]|nr:hypothetical protein J4526_02270 [Desulfurococcaceae archaeon MEX13E-LK6-19]